MRLLEWISNTVILQKAFWHDSPFLRSSSKRFLVIAVFMMMLMAAQMFQFLSDSSSASWNEDRRCTYVQDDPGSCLSWACHWISSEENAVFYLSVRLVGACLVKVWQQRRLGVVLGIYANTNNVIGSPSQANQHSLLNMGEGMCTLGCCCCNSFFYNNQRKSFCRGKVWRILLPFFTSFRVSMEHKSYSWQKSSLETDMQLIFDVFIINDIRHLKSWLSLKFLIWYISFYNCSSLISF